MQKKHLEQQGIKTAPGKRGRKRQNPDNIDTVFKQTTQKSTFNDKEQSDDEKLSMGSHENDNQFQAPINPGVQN